MDSSGKKILQRFFSSQLYIYIGQTKNNLSKRLNDHKYDRKQVTALIKHQKEMGHEFNFIKLKSYVMKTGIFHARKKKRLKY